MALDPGMEDAIQRSVDARIPNGRCWTKRKDVGCPPPIDIRCSAWSRWLLIDIMRGVHIPWCLLTPCP